MSSTNRVKRNLAVSIALAFSFGIAVANSVGAAPAGVEDVSAVKGAGKAKTLAGVGAKSDDTHGIANGGTREVDTGSGSATGAKSDRANDTKSDGANGAGPATITGTKDDAASGAEKGTKPDATDGAPLSAADVKSSAAQQITPLDPSNSSAEAVEEEDPYAAYNKQQMALFQQHEAVQHYNAAKYYMKNWDNELAELELRAAIMYMPELRIAHRDYCIVALVRGKILRAIAEFCMVFGIGEPIALTQEQQAALRTEASQAHYKKGLELATKGNWDESISELMWARTYLPNDPAVHRSLAFAYASKGDFKLAEQYYQSTFSIDPNDAFAHADFAYLLSKKGKTNEAVSEMAKAVKADPDSPALHVDLGWLAESKGDLKTAETEFRAALNRAPQYAQLWYHLGQILEKRKMTSDAVAAYKTAIEKEPSNKQAQAALVRLSAPLVAPSASAGGPTTPIKAAVQSPAGQTAKTPATAGSHSPTRAN